jgi:hypothetical protein
LRYKFGVKRFHRIVALCVLAVWSACMVRCELEATLHAAASCCDEGEKPSPAPVQANHCICTFVQSGGIIYEKSDVSIPAQTAAVFVLTAAFEANDFQPKPAFAGLTHSPPDHLNCWQFSFRTALPPRAPSFIS